VLGRTLWLSPNNAIDNDNSTGENAWTGDTKSIYSKASVLGAIHSAGHYKWEGIETLNNGFNEGLTFVSDGPVYFALQNCNKYPIFIHAIRVTTKTDPAGIDELKVSDQAKAPLYTLGGQRVSQPSAKGVYVKAGRKILK